MFRALKDEIKNAVTKSFFHIIRFIGLMFIPFVYGFSYIYAFYDPFEKVANAKFSIVTNWNNDKKSYASNDPLGSALGRVFSKESEMKMGDMKMTMKMDHIYNDQNINIDDITNDSYATMVISNLNAIDTLIKDYIKGKASNSIIIKAELLFDVLKTMIAPKNKLVEFHLNYKKNYLLPFGIKTGMSMYTSLQFLESKIVEAIKDEKYIEHVREDLSKESSPINVSVGDIRKYLSEEFKFKSPLKVNPIHVEAKMHEHAKYGYGLAPFFISVSMWIGSMALTFAVHRKVYSKNISPGRRYLAKWLLMAFGVIGQATILMVSLYIIGFSKLGLENWFSLYIGAIIAGLVFMSIIQGIRFSIHNRTLGIFIIIILLVFQMASGGGLFPLQTQSSFYQIINKIVPIGRTVNIFRELSFETNWSVVFENFGYLSIWLISVPVGVYIYHKRTAKMYEINNWELPKWKGKGGK